MSYLFHKQVKAGERRNLRSRSRLQRFRALPVCQPSGQQRRPCPCPQMAHRLKEGAAESPGRPELGGQKPRCCVRRGARCSPALGTDSKRDRLCCQVWEIVSPPSAPRIPAPPHAPRLAADHLLRCSQPLLTLSSHVSPPSDHVTTLTSAPSAHGAVGQQGQVRPHIHSAPSAFGAPKP